MSDFITPFNPSSDQTPISDCQTPYGINEPINNKDNDLQKVIYKTPKNRAACFLSIIFFIFGLIPTCLIIFFSIYFKDVFLTLHTFFPLLISAVGFALGSYFSKYFIITIDANSGIVVIESKKPFCCFNKKTTIEIKNIQQVLVETDKFVSYKSGKNTYYSFKVIFKLFDERDIIGCSGVIDKNNSGRNAFDIIRKALPQYIPVFLNLESNNNKLYYY